MWWWSARRATLGLQILTLKAWCVTLTARLRRRTALTASDLQPALGALPPELPSAPPRDHTGVDVLALDKRGATTQRRPRHVRNIYDEEKHTRSGGRMVCVQTLLRAKPCERCAEIAAQSDLLSGV